MVELDAADAVEVDDDVAVVVDAHEDALGALELAGDDDDVAAALVGKGCGVDVGEGVLMVGDHVHETLHVTFWHCDGGAPLATAQQVAAVLHIAQVAGVLFFQVDELVLEGLDDDEVEDGGDQHAMGMALLIALYRPFHRHEVLDALTVEEVFYAEDFLGAGIIDAQGVPLAYGRPSAVCTRGSCRLGRDHNWGDCMCIITLH